LRIKEQETHLISNEHDDDDDDDNDIVWLRKNSPNFLSNVSLKTWRKADSP